MNFRQIFLDIDTTKTKGVLLFNNHIIKNTDYIIENNNDIFFTFVFNEIAKKLFNKNTNFTFSMYTYWLPICTFNLEYNDYIDEKLKNNMYFESNIYNLNTIQANYKLSLTSNYYEISNIHIEITISFQKTRNINFIHL